MAELKKYSMDDVGTRMEHLSDLQELWSSGVDIMMRGTYHSEREKEQLAKLEAAVHLLENHMMKDYHSIEYAKEINRLPKNAGDITDENPTT